MQFGLGERGKAWAGAGLAAAFFWLGDPLAFAVEIQNDRVMDQPVNGGHGRHRILENLVPLGEHQILPTSTPAS
jgi:hypothetical protein